jgi:Flp pilus assembly protein TadB
MIERAERSEVIAQAFMRAWDEFGDDVSTEFLAQITADRLGVDIDEVFAALEREE